MGEILSKAASALPIRHIAEVANEELAYIRGRMNGKITSLLTPWKKFNQAAMNGIEWGSIITIAGMSGGGKTAILNELETGLFEHNPGEDFDVLDFNFEMLARRLVGRKLSKKLNLSVKQLYSAEMMGARNLTAEDWKFANDYVAKHLSKYPIFYVDQSGSISQIRQTIIQHFSTKKVKRGTVVMLDHSLLVKRLKGQSQLDALYELGEMANELKKLYPVIFIFLSQLNRGIEAVERIQNPELHYPQKSDVFGADALYQYSDVFMITHRPEMLGLETYGPQHLPTGNFLYWHYLKVRDGDPMIAQMANNLKFNRIDELKDTVKS